VTLLKQKIKYAHDNTGMIAKAAFSAAIRSSVSHHMILQKMVLMNKFLSMFDIIVEAFICNKSFVTL